MRLSSFRIQNYRSVVDSGQITTVDIMVLVGPNQSGKSSILQGLHSLSFSYSYDEQNELTQLDSISKKFIDGDLKASELPIVTTNFMIEDVDRQTLKKEFSPAPPTASNSSKAEQSSSSQNTVSSSAEADLGILKDVNSAKEIIITKFIDGTYKVTLGKTIITFRNPLEQISKVKQLISQLKKETQSDFNRDPNKAHKPTFDALYGQFLLTESRDMIPKSNMIDPLNNFINNYGVDADLKTKLQAALKQIQEVLSEYPPSNDSLKVISFLFERMPRTVYFKDYEKLEDSITIAELRSNPSSHKTFLNLIELAEIRIETLEQRLKDKPAAIQQYLQSVSGNVTKKLRGIWKQESFDLSFRYEGQRLMVFTTDPQEPVTLLPPSYGSEGFQWYLGFYINFAVATKTEYKNAILLLDDPGVMLHPEGHKDLLRRFREYLNDDVRTIYTTHLPSLIPKDSIGSVRVVEKVNGRAVVTENFWKLDNKDSWAPVRAALGIELADSLLAGNQTIMIEGPSDSIYLSTFRSVLRNQGKNVTLDGFLLPLSGVTNAEYFVKLFDSQQLPYVVLTDTTKIESLKLPSQTRVMQISPKNKARPAQKEFDIEDMLENDLIVKALGFTYPDTNTKTIAEKLSSSSKKVVTVIREQLRAEAKDLDKVKLAKSVQKIVSESPDQYKSTLENFEELFKQIEKLSKADILASTRAETVVTKA